MGSGGISLRINHGSRWSPGIYPRGKSPHTPWIGSVVPRAGLDAVQKRETLVPSEVEHIFLGRPACSLVTIRLSYPNPEKYVHIFSSKNLKERDHFIFSSKLKMEAADSSESLVPVLGTAPHRFPEDGNFNTDGRENPKQ
jgi:hypothetical protein